MRKEKWPKTAVNAFWLRKLPALAGNRGHWIPWHCHNCSQKLRNSCFCASAVKIWLEIIPNVVKSPKFASVYKKSMSVRTVITGFRSEAYTVCSNKKDPSTKTSISSKRRNIFARNFQLLLGRKSATDKTSFVQYYESLRKWSDFRFSTRYFQVNAHLWLP